MIARAASLFVILTLGLMPGAATAQQVPVDVELVLAVDVSYSINEAEFNLQMAGIASAFRNPAFLASMRSAAPRGIAVSLVQWAREGSSRQVIPWHYVIDPVTAAGFANQVLRVGRRIQPGPTGIGSAMQYSVSLLETNGFAGARKVIDVSGDGTNNSGIVPDVIRAQAMGLGITVNGLTILNDVGYLDSYYQNHVIGGPGSFVMSSPDFEGFALAFRLKLIREVTGGQLAALP